MKKICLLLLMILPLYLLAQSFTASQLLEKTIQYHDPNDNWDTFNSTLKFGQETPDDSNAFRWAHINNTEGSFAFWQEKEEGKIKHFIKDNVCEHTVAGKADFSEETAKKYKLNCKRTQLWRDYYTYLYGLPMKLKDSGTLLSDAVLDTTFMDKSCWAISITYDEEVGKDKWYFYLDKSTFALIGYRFFHDESKNDEEYIVLKEEAIVQGVRIPKVRSWYYNLDDKFLGTDILE
jgi:hypothetical protein